LLLSSPGIWVIPHFTIVCSRNSDEYSKVKDDIIKVNSRKIEPTSGKSCLDFIERAKAMAPLTPANQRKN
jgi:hypothetical protein